MEGNVIPTAWTTSDTSVYQQAPHFYGNEPQTKKEPKLVYGLKGIADFLHQSITTAWRLKSSGKYNAAISQRGRCIITDTDKLLELMRLDRQPDQQIYCYNGTI